MVKKVEEFAPAARATFVFIPLFQWRLPNRVENRPPHSRGIHGLDAVLLQPQSSFRIEVK
jgi:hypothetical protein